MSELHLDSLEITNFRCFEHLVIEKLGRVNLIVGKNSVGKTALLEALWLLGSEADGRIIQKILYDRNELVRYKSAESREDFLADYSEIEEQRKAIESLFFGRPPKNRERITMYTGTSPTSAGTFSREANVFKIASSHRSISMAIYEHPKDVYLLKDNRDTRHFNQLANAISGNDEERKPSNSVFERSIIRPLPKQDSFESSAIEISKYRRTVFIPVSGLTWKATCNYWETITLSDKEDQIISCLQGFEPSIKKINFIGETAKDNVRFPIARTERFHTPLPLANLGEGIQRVLALALAMSVANDGYLLVDEFETGFHHSIQTNVWRAVFKLANEWNVQVFATTHSWDCVEAFQEAAAEDQNEEAMLIRLQKKRTGDGIEAVIYDEDLLVKATRQQVEVR